MSGGLQYRPDVDGLRAIAVVAVVLFHADVAVLSGGFVGVDVFFVISGYLITSLIVTELRDGRFSLARFYERRIRRIFPALFLVVGCTTAVAVAMLMPLALVDFGRSAMATALFSSNFLFWHDTGYFDAPAEGKPLLHTWSLAVEEQFYLVFPLFLLGIVAAAPRRWRHVLAATAVVSFAFSVWQCERDPSAAFYLLPSRAWELLAGALTAVVRLPVPRSRKLREALAALGALLVLSSMLLLTEGTRPFPGLGALAPVAGTVLLLHAGHGTTTAVTRLLSARPLVFVGLISYSFYLWHWPLLVLARYQTGDTLTAPETTALVALAFLLSVLSWKYVEQPFRRRAPDARPAGMFAAGATATVATLVAGVMLVQSSGWPGRFPEGVSLLSAVAASRDPRQTECMGDVRRWIAPEKACRYGADVAPGWAIWGDSHADALVYPLGKLAARHRQSVRLYSYSGCPPVLGIRPRNPNPAFRCPEYNEQVLDDIQRSEPMHTVILVARHTIYLDGPARELGPADAGHRDVTITAPDGGELSLEERQALYGRQFRATLDRLAAAGKRVVLVDPIPETGHDIPLLLARRTREGYPLDFTVSHEFYRRRNRFILGLFESHTSPLVLRVRPQERLCPGARCIVHANGQVLYFDDDHLSLAGAAHVLPLFEPLFEANAPVLRSRFSASVR